MTIYAFRVSDVPEDMEKVAQSLWAGAARFGWSYVESADLRQLRERIKQASWRSLSAAERDCYQEFLLDVREGDYVIYINVPEWSMCTMARVVGPYEWRWDGPGFGFQSSVAGGSGFRTDLWPEQGDRTGCAECPPEAARPVVADLRGGRIRHVAAPVAGERRLRLQILGNQPAGAITWGAPATRGIRRETAAYAPGKDLEILIEKLLLRVPSVTSVQRLEGSADHGADLLVDFEFVDIPGLVQTQTLAVQVKSFTDVHSDTGAVDDIRRAFDHYERQGHPIDMGLIVSTANAPTVQLMYAADKLQEESGKPVSVLIGVELIKFFLRYGGDFLQRRE